MSKSNGRWVEEVIIRNLERSPECARLRQHIDWLKTGHARAEVLTETTLAMQELWNDIRGNAGLTPHIVLNSYLDRAANRLIDALKRTDAVVGSPDKEAMRSAAGTMLQGLLRSAAAAHQSTAEHRSPPQSGMSDALTANRDAFMRYGVRRGKAFSITRIMAALDLSFAEARQRTRRGTFSDEELALLLELPVGVIPTLSSPNPSAAALNQLIEHTGYRDIAPHMRHDAAAQESTAIAAHNADNERVLLSDVASAEVDGNFDELAAKFKSSKDFTND